ncbi:hypothetical protein [Sediminivirga luteola]|uniref:Uncharacterized protein n=1 Tax=Sediminivirga luteola TaxID=1774748 RepID=A0A8J2TYF6_9MICO|nr:hypothetical protein [Sediminivirga luteola]GGA15734.1 hypothetical protein GCM10011333_18400 [Sediminivirga luteola]
MSEQDRDDQQVPKRATPPDGPARPDVQESTTEESRATASERTTAREREVSELARRRDPSLDGKDPATARDAARWDARGVAWVRPTDLVAQSSARWAGRGISFETELARRMRRLPLEATAATRTAISERARRLPPLSAFGRSRGSGHSGTSRSEIGLG